MLSEHTRFHALSRCRLALAFATTLAGSSLCPAPLRAQSTPAIQAASQPAIANTKPGVPFSPQVLASLLPQSVYFHGRTAALQLRNAAGVSFGAGAIVWAGLVDTSGYASNVQDRYQFYLVTESALLFGNSRLPAGVYGGGFVGDHFILMDIGGRTVAEGNVETDAAMPRPRPLQMLPDSPNAVRLALGRHWVRLQIATL